MKTRAAVAMPVLLAALAGPASAQVDAAPPATVTVPTTSDRGWHVLQFRGIPAHDVDFLETGLVIQVRRSAAPVIYELPEPIGVAGLRVWGRLDGVLAIPADVQGDDGYDDYALRAGVVLAGDRRLNFFQRRHPLNDLLVEEVVTAPDPDGSFMVDVSIDAAEPAIAVWLGADGDDTGSEFTVQVERIELILRRESSDADSGPRP